jgi:membrane protein implicated in regulation of membrane protease activity
MNPYILIQHLYSDPSLLEVYLHTYYAPLAWFVLSIVFLLAETHVPGSFYGLAPTVGALVSCVAAAYSFSPLEQVVCFITSSLLCFMMLRLWVRFAQKAPALRTNIDALIGARGFVKTTCSSLKRGSVYIRNEEWSAYAVHDEIIEKGALVEVIAIKGCHLIISPLQKRGSS